ncbi:uncharacterized protein KZ484_000545 [Pholidichthys leucotaenia]
MEFLRNLNYSQEHNLWIGLTRDSNYGWAWTDNTAVGYLNWAPGEPNAAFHPGEIGEEMCVEMYPDGRWNDNNCLQKRGFACRHRQHYTTDEDKNPGDDSGLSTGTIVGIIAAVIICICIVGAVVYVLRVRGYKISSVNFPTRTTSNVDVTGLSNPNFAGELDT